MEDENNDRLNEDAIAKIFSGKMNVKELPENELGLETTEEGTTEKLSSIQKEKTKDKQKTEKEPENKENKEADDDSTLKKEYELLKKNLEETKAWGQKNNISIVNMKRNLTKYLNKLVEDGNLFEEDVSKAMETILTHVATEDPKEAPGVAADPLAEAVTKLNSEFAIFKKYAKIDNAEEKYGAFFSFWPMLNKDEQESLSVYLQDEQPDIALEKVMMVGAELYDNIYSGAKEKGGILPYIKSIKTKNLKLEEKIKELEAELDITTEKVYTKSINSKGYHAESAKKQRTEADIFRYG